MSRRVLLLFVGAWASLQLQAHVEMNYPQGGETYSPGDSVNITWTETVAHNTLNWDLLYSVDGGHTWSPIKEDIPLEARSYQWIIPDVSTMDGRIKIIQDNEGGDYESSSQNFTITSITGIIDPVQSNEISIFPNPFEDFATIEFNNPEYDSYTLTIYNPQGGVVRSITHLTSGKIELERGNLIAGYYFIQLRDDKQVRATARIVIH